MFLFILTVFIWISNTVVISWGLILKLWKFDQHIAIALSIGLFQLIAVYVSIIPNHQLQYLLLSFPVGLLYGPLLYLIMEDNTGIGKKKALLIHILPFLVATAIYSITSSNLTFRYRYHNGFAQSIQFITLLHILIYLLLIKQKVICSVLRNRRQMILNTSLYFLIIVVAVLYIFLLYNIMRANYDQNFNLLLYFILFIGTSIQFAWKISINEKEMDRSIPQQAVESKMTSVSKINPKSSISERKRSLYQGKVDSFIQDLGFLEIDLNKESFSDQTGISFKDVSVFLKMEYGKSFSNFVNQLRLEYAVKQLKMHKMVYTIEDLSLVCGFNSRASFYRNFKNQFGCSPHEFRDKFINGN
jgi:AraC-like DNA-binding protein